MGLRLMEYPIAVLDASVLFSAYPRKTRAYPNSRICERVQVFDLSTIVDLRN